MFPGNTHESYVRQLLTPEFQPMSGTAPLSSRAPPGACRTFRDGARAHSRMDRTHVHPWRAQLWSNTRYLILPELTVPGRREISQTALPLLIFSMAFLFADYFDYLFIWMFGLQTSVKTLHRTKIYLVAGIYVSLDQLTANLCRGRTFTIFFLAFYLFV